MLISYGLSEYLFILETKSIEINDVFNSTVSTEFMVHFQLSQKKYKQENVHSRNICEFLYLCYKLTQGLTKNSKRIERNKNLWDQKKRRGRGVSGEKNNFNYFHP